MVLEEKLANTRNVHLSVQPNPSYTSISLTPSPSCTSNSGCDDAFLYDDADPYEIPVDTKKSVSSFQPIASDYEVPRSTTYAHLEHEYHYLEEGEDKLYESVKHTDT